MIKDKKQIAFCVGNKKRKTAICCLLCFLSKYLSKVCYLIHYLHTIIQQNTTLSELFQTIVEIGTMDIIKTEIHDRSLFWLSTGTLIKKKKGQGWPSFMPKPNIYLGTKAATVLIPYKRSQRNKQDSLVDPIYTPLTLAKVEILDNHMSVLCSHTMST